MNLKDHLADRDRPPRYLRGGDSGYFFPDRIRVYGHSGWVSSFYRFRVEDVLPAVVSTFDRVNELLECGETVVEMASQCADCRWKEVGYEVSCRVHGIILAEIAAMGRGVLSAYGSTGAVCPVHEKEAGNNRFGKWPKGEWLVRVPIGSFEERVGSMISAAVDRPMAIRGTGILRLETSPPTTVSYRNRGDGTVALSFAEDGSLRRTLEGLKSLEVARDFPLALVATDESGTGFLDSAIARLAD